MLTPSQVGNDLEADGQANSAPGVVIPPHDIRSMVDKAARFIASIEPRYEKIIIAGNAALRKFTFLYDEDPYHAYYQHQVSEFRAQNGSTLSADGNDPFRPKWLSDKVVKGVSIERLRETVKWYARGAEKIAAAAAAAITVVSPITGELIPVHKMFQHMQTSVTEPKYEEQKERLFAKIRETTLAQDDEISLSIVELSRTRPDIFGTIEEEFSNAVKEEIERRTIPVLDLDGHTATKAISAEDGVTGLRSLPSLPPPSPQCSLTSLPQHGMPIAPQGMFEEPEPKRQRLDDSLLVPEDQFLAQHPGPVCIRVWVPETGKTLEISVESSSESVSSLKEKIAAEIEVPADKQKLSGKVGFFNDNLSLAYYNIAAGEMLSLSWC